MACTPQDLVNAFPCFGCLTEAQGDWTLTMLTCVAAGGVTPPPSDIIVIGEEAAGGGIIGGETGGGDEILIGAE